MAGKRQFEVNSRPEVEPEDAEVAETAIKA